MLFLQQIKLLPEIVNMLLHLDMHIILLLKFSLPLLYKCYVQIMFWKKKCLLICVSCWLVRPLSSVLFFWKKAAVVALFAILCHLILPTYCSCWRSHIWFAVLVTSEILQLSKIRQLVRHDLVVNSHFGWCYLPCYRLRSRCLPRDLCCPL
jgi:hypothetical protein